jgi:hypothetical protein
MGRHMFIESVLRLYWARRERIRAESRCGLLQTRRIAAFEPAAIAIVHGDGEEVAPPTLAARRSTRSSSRAPAPSQGCWKRPCALVVLLTIASSRRGHTIAKALVERRGVRGRGAIDARAAGRLSQRFARVTPRCVHRRRKLLLRASCRTSRLSAGAPARHRRRRQTAYPGSACSAARPARLQPLARPGGLGWLLPPRRQKAARSVRCVAVGGFSQQGPSRVGLRHGPLWGVILIVKSAEAREEEFQRSGLT